MVDTIGLLAGTGWAAGLNLYLATFLLGLAGRLDWLEVPAALERTDVMIGAGVLYAIEFFADKIPYLDNLWDAVHTFVRPLGAGVLGYLLAGESPSISQIVGAVISGSLALSSHSAKATTRAAVNTSPEPFSNIFLSLMEDGIVAGLVGARHCQPGDRADSRCRFDDSRRVAGGQALRGDSTGQATNGGASRASGSLGAKVRRPLLEEGLHAFEVLWADAQLALHPPFLFERLGKRTPGCAPRESRGSPRRRSWARSLAVLPI